MANTLGVYNPYFYANEALILLEKNLGFASRIHRGFDAERAAFDKGEYIQIRRPASFTAANAPVTSAGDFTTETVSLQLDQWREVKFYLTDKELAFTGERIIEDHIRPAVYALADDIDGKVAALYDEIGNTYHIDESTPDWPTEVAECRRVLRDVKCPLQEADRMHFAVNGRVEAALLASSAFSQYQGGGEAGVAEMRAGTLGRKYGFEFFASQNIKTHTRGTWDGVAAVDNGAGYAAGETTVHIDGAGDTLTILEGDSFYFANHSQRYTCRANVTTNGTGDADVTIAPALQAAVVDDEVVTCYAGKTATDTFEQNLAFHRNFAAVAFGRLPDALPNQLGAKVASIQDPVSGISVRSRMYYDGTNSKVFVALDVLYGIKLLDPQLACRFAYTT